MASFGEGFANAFTSTYSALSAAEARKKAEERADAEERRRAIDFQQRQDETRGFRDAAQSTYGRIGKEALSGDLQKDAGIGPQQAQGLGGGSGDAAFDAFDREQLTDTLRANAKSQGASVPSLPTYTREQAAKDYAARLYALDPLKGQQAEAGALEIRRGEQQLQLGEQQIDLNKKTGKKVDFELDALEKDKAFREKFEKTLTGALVDKAKREQSIDEVAQAGGMRGLVEKFGPDLRKAFKADVQLVGNNIVVKIPGQKSQTISNVEQATQMLRQVAEKELVHNLETRMIGQGLFKTPEDLVSYLRNQREDARKERDTESQIGLRGAQAVEARAKAGYYGAASKAAGEKTGNWTLVGADKDGQLVSYDRNTGKLARADGQPIQDTSIYRRVTGENSSPPKPVTPADINSFIRDQAMAVVDVNKSDKNKPILLRDLPLAEQVAIARQQLGQGGMPPTGGMPDANPRAMEKPGQALPTAAEPAAPAKQGPTERQSPAAIKASNPYQFEQLYLEAQQTLPQLQMQVLTMTKALPLARSNAERANLEARRAALIEDANFFQGVIDQRNKYD